MPQSVKELASEIIPSRTILLFGSGASIPSGAPSVEDLCMHLAKSFKQERGDYNLAELTGIIEQKSRSRRQMIDRLREPFNNLRPTGGLLNLPLFSWR